MIQKKTKKLILISKWLPVLQLKMSTVKPIPKQEYQKCAERLEKIEAYCIKNKIKNISEYIMIALTVYPDEINIIDSVKI